MDDSGRASVSPALAAEYSAALSGFLSGGGEKWLQEAHELGRRAIAGGLGVLDVVALHERMTHGDVPCAGYEFLREALSAFEMTHRGFAEANAELRDLNDSLQRLVEERTQDVRERQRLSQALNEVNDLMRRGLGSEQIMRDALAKGAETVGAESGSVARADGSGWVVRYVWGLKPDIVGRRFENERNPSTELAVQQGKPVVGEDAQWTDHAGVSVGDRGSTTIVAPIVVQDRTIAVLHVNHHGRSHRFSRPEVDFVEKLASSLSLALRDVMSFEAEHRIAEVLQEALLSLPERLRGVEFAHAYHSASEAARVGGDFYDIFELSQQHIGITIGDVAGKGLNAAVLTSLAKNTIRAHATERGKTPRQVLELTNGALFRATPTESFATVFFGILDTRDGRLVYSNAGHTTAAVLREHGAPGRLQPTGPLLGAFEDVEFDEAEVDLGPRETLILYTDGLTEARRGKEQYGDGRLFELLSSMRARGAEQVVHALVSDVMEFTENRLRDDLAILTVTRVEQQPDIPQQQKLEL